MLRKSIFFRYIKADAEFIIKDLEIYTQNYKHRGIYTIYKSIKSKTKQSENSNKN